MARSLIGSAMDARKGWPVSPLPSALPKPIRDRIEALAAKEAEAKATATESWELEQAIKPLEARGDERVPEMKERSRMLKADGARLADEAAAEYRALAEELEGDAAVIEAAKKVQSKAREEASAVADELVTRLETLQTALDALAYARALSAGLYPQGRTPPVSANVRMRNGNFYGADTLAAEISKALAL